MKKTEIYFICKKEYVIRNIDELYPTIDAAFRINKTYKATKSSNPLFIYDFKFDYLMYSVSKEQIKELFYSTKEIRKQKLDKLNSL